MRIRSVLLATVMTASAGVGVVALQAPQASAAAHTCNSGQIVHNAHIRQTQPNYNGSISCYLNGGANRNATATRALQKALNTCYHAGLAVDGIYGPATTRALANRVQAGHSTPDGLYGPATAKYIKTPIWDATGHQKTYCG